MRCRAPYLLQRKERLVLQPAPRQQRRRKHQRVYVDVPCREDETEPSEHAEPGKPLIVADTQHANSDNAHAGMLTQKCSLRLAEWKVSAMRLPDMTVYLASTTKAALAAGCELSSDGTLSLMMFCTVPAAGELKRW